MIVETKLNRKEPEIKTDKCMVSCVHELSFDDFQSFRNNLLEDYSFISDNVHKMYEDEKGVSHCLLVLDKVSGDGILVESEGASYARYSAFLPNARILLMLDQHPSLQQLIEGMQKLTDKYVHEAVINQTDGLFRFNVEDYDIVDNGISEYFNENLFLDMLSERNEIECVDYYSGQTHLMISPDCVLKEDDSKFRRLTGADVEIMCAQHVLWLNEMNGERADFSDCLLEDLNLSYKNLNGALFNNAKLVNVNLHGAEMGTAGFNGATLRGCNLTETEAEQATFKDAKLLYSSLDRAIFTDSNFSGAQFHGSNMNGGSFKNCCLEDADMKFMTMNSVNMDKCSYDEQAWERAMYPVPEQKI